MTIIDTYIRQIDLFQNLDEQNLARLSEICYRKNYVKKETIFIEGEPGQAIFFCVKGNIQLFRTQPDGRETAVKIIKPGEAFAEVILFEKDKYPVSAVALRPSDLLIIPKRQFNDLLKDKDFRDAFITMLIHKQRYLVHKIQMLSSQDVEERLYHFLKEQFGDQQIITPKLSKKDVASAIGTVPETLSRVLNRLKSENKLEWKGDTIRMDLNWKL
jgi:CRP-like cAMP-binding protein